MAVFPTVLSPNPEEPEALKMAVALEETKKMRISCDRYRSRRRPLGNRGSGFGKPMVPSQRQSNHDCFNRIPAVQKTGSENQLTPQPLYCQHYCLYSPMIKALAEEYQIQFKNCLTGFKWIAKLIEDHPEVDLCGWW